MQYHQGLPRRHLLPGWRIKPILYVTLFGNKSRLCIRGSRGLNKISLSLEGICGQKNAMCFSGAVLRTPIHLNANCPQLAESFQQQSTFVIVGFTPAKRGNRESSRFVLTT